jgi:formylglycine-generating enzyme required for sulfatase activity
MHRHITFYLAIVQAVLGPASALAVSVSLVTVGNPGNAADDRYGNGRGGPVIVGSVDHIYQIDKYEITASQYTEFLNAVAKSDPNGLYNPAMADPGTSEGANIQRSGSSSNYTYSVAADWASRPVNYVSFWDAARFANWLDNGQPTGPQGPATTEGGAYHDVGNQTLFGRNSGAKFFIPTEDEWYKAAYHKNDGVTGNYWDYPTASNIAPINTLPDTGNHANFYDTVGSGNHGDTIGGPYLRTQVGSFTNSPSPYGTFDQGGNVGEWNESTVLSTVKRGERGGWYESTPDLLKASYQGALDPTFESPLIGFRVASLPLLLGDYNSNGIVDIADYILWRNELNKAVTLPNDPTPGSVSQADYSVWRAHFGQEASGSGAGDLLQSIVPEPTASALLVALAGVFYVRRLKN